MNKTFSSRNPPDPMTTLCRLVVDTEYDDLPVDVVRYAKKCILDTLAVIIGGSAMEGIEAVVNIVKNKGGKPESIIPLYGGRVPASEAAFAIGPMARAMDLGDAHTEGGHCSEYILPALLAAIGLKRKITGKEFITAFALGQELLVRIGVAYKVVSEAIPAGQIGGHYIFGCIASVGKVLGLSLEELENAQGIGKGMTQPHDVAMLDPPSLMIRIHHGFVCQDAINACLLAQNGITGPRGEYSDVLTGAKGYLALAKWETDSELLTKELGEKWEMLNISMKPNPACGCTHTSITGILKQMEEYGFEAEDIDVINLDVSPVIWTAVCLPKEKRWNPRTISECQFSLPYIIATTAYDKDVFLNSYTEEARARKDIHDLMNRVSVKEDTTLSSFAVRIHTKLKNGDKYSTDSFYFKGQPMMPFSEDELIERLKKSVPYSAYKLSDSAVKLVTDTVLNLEKIDDVMENLVYPLAPEWKGD